jgi:hypothetical protein
MNCVERRASVSLGLRKRAGGFPVTKMEPPESVCGLAASAAPIHQPLFNVLGCDGASQPWYPSDSDTAPPRTRAAFPAHGSIEAAQPMQDKCQVDLCWSQKKAAKSYVRSWYLHRTQNSRYESVNDALIDLVEARLNNSSFGGVVDQVFRGRRLCNRLVLPPRHFADAHLGP